MYAIKDKERDVFVTGTDFSRQTEDGFLQIVSSVPMKTYDTKASATRDFKRRKCGKGYEVVEV